MNTKIFGALMMVAVLTITSAANANEAANQQHQKHHKFEHRIKKDVRNGEITKLQAKHFKMEAKRIHQEKRADIAKGTFTPAEKMRIHKEKKMLSNNLKRDEQNNDKVKGVF